MFTVTSKELGKMIIEAIDDVMNQGVVDSDEIYNHVSSLYNLPCLYTTGDYKGLTDISPLTGKACFPDSLRGSRANVTLACFLNESASETIVRDTNEVRGSKLSKKDIENLAERDFQLSLTLFNQLKDSAYRTAKKLQYNQAIRNYK